MKKLLHSNFFPGISSQYGGCTWLYICTSWPRDVIAAFYKTGITPKLKLESTNAVTFSRKSRQNHLHFFQKRYCLEAPYQQWKITTVMCYLNPLLGYHSLPLVLLPFKLLFTAVVLKEMTYIGPTVVCSR